jgi:hypothetical protein
MTIADSTLPVYDQMLGALDGWLAKAQADDRGDALLAARLADDMHPLARQIRFVCNMPGEAMVRIAGIAFASSDEDDATLTAARVRIAAARAAITGWNSAAFVADTTPIALSLPNAMTFDLTAEGYVRDWALPQFYFHLMIAYAILRANGVPLGKIDYVPYMMRYLRPAAPA